MIVLWVTPAILLCAWLALYYTGMSYRRRWLRRHLGHGDGGFAPRNLPLPEDIVRVHAGEMVIYGRTHIPARPFWPAPLQPMLPIPPEPELSVQYEKAKRAVSLEW